MFQARRYRQFWSDPPRSAYLIIAPCAIGLVFLTYSSLHFYQVAGRQRLTEGKIVAHAPRNHNQYAYTFSVDERLYQGWESPRRQPLTVGQQVLVYYDPADPETNALTDFSTLSLEAFGPLPLLSVGSLAAIAIIFRLRRRARIREAP